MTKSPYDKKCAQITQNLQTIRENIAKTCAVCGRNPKDVRLMAVTKTVDPAYVNHAIGCGIGLLGENRCQEFLDKYQQYKPADVHFIGHLQTNKVKYIIDKVSMIESVDSLKLAHEIDKEAGKKGLVMDILLEVNIGQEDTKSGVLPQDLPQLLEEAAQLPHIHIRGLMAIPPKISSLQGDIDKYFAKMYQLFIDITHKKMDNITMDVLSMGMSHDYMTAIRYGSNILRLGTAIFGSRI